MTKHIAVVLFNLGGPDKKESIKPFLFNFFMDPNIIRAPKIVRYGVATLISILRTRKQAGESYAKLGNKSPLLENTRAQATALSTRLNVDANVKFSVHVCMRYWHPMAEEVAQRVKNDNPDQIILLPLYPQFSTTTTWSSFGEWQKACAKVDMDKPTGFVCCYPTQAGFIAASADLIRTQYDAMREECEAQGMKPPRVLFSAHGLPEDIIADGDPYQWQCEKTAELIAAQLGIPQKNFMLVAVALASGLMLLGGYAHPVLRDAAWGRVLNWWARAPVLRKRRKSA